MEFAKVEAPAFTALCVGAAIAFIVPLAIALIWKFTKKERFSTILVGSATFILFALILEKPIQNFLLFPTQMGLPDHAVSSFLSARPLLLALLAGLFPGIFEETGRLAAFKTLLRNRKNRETSVSHGIGHAGTEVMLTLGLTYITYIMYAVMINSGAFVTVVDQVKAVAPDQVGTLTTLAEQLTKVTISDIGLGYMERIFAFLFHVGASILVFYACRDKGRFWLYPLAILLHTAMDFVSALYLFKVISLPLWAVEALIGVFGLLVFFGAYVFLYRKNP